MQLTEMATDNLRPSKFHKRTIWGDMDGLAESVAIHGIIEPPVVRPNGEIICGERRRRAALKAGLKTIQCLVRDVDDATAISIQIEENLKRQDSHPLDEAMLFRELVTLGHDPGAIATRFAIARRHVTQRLQLCGLIDAAATAYAAGDFDDAAALAIARLSSENQQADVIAAVRAGSLQADEIESYCRREFMVSLDDVPWRVSDETLVPAAGACTTCPKRSGHQRDLFPEANVADRCLDVTCYRSKMNAAYLVAAARATDEMKESFCATDAPNLFIPVAGGGRPAVMRSSGYIDAEASCPHISGLTWREAIASACESDSMPGEYLARDQDGRPRYLFRESVAARLVKKSDAAQAQRQANVDAGQPPDAVAVARSEAKIHRAVVDQIAEKAAASDPDCWAWIVERILAGVSARALAATVDQFVDQMREIGVAEDRSGLAELVRKSNRRAKQVAVAVLVREEADGVGELPDTVREIAKICGVDVRAIERGIRKDRSE